MRRSEDNLQAAIVSYVRTVAPDCLLFSVPNGGKRSIPEALMLRATGMVAGVPDLALVEPGGRIRFFEVKPPGKTLSANQRAIRDRLHSMSVSCITVQSIDEVRLALREWKISTKEATP